ncbi:hypothetical protein NL676_013738 [Syzygium grande]|nr:hypothetical protein NL676_013738 [Syzygium grande]
MLPKCRQKLSLPFPLTKQTLATLLKACSSQPHQLEQIHAVVLTTGLSVKNSLITQLLANLVILGDIQYARKLFDEMHKPRIFLWNTLIRGYAKNDMPMESVSLYGKMTSLGVRPDGFTFPFVVKASAELPDCWAGLTIHAHVVKYGLEYNAMVRNELMIMYVKFGDVRLADYLFETMIERDLVAWNSFIAACVQMGYASKALSLFHQMGLARMTPDAVTIVSALSACGQLGCLNIGNKIFESAVNDGMESNIIVENARLDMCVKCGSTHTARTLFDEMHLKNVVSWSAMILGYAVNGKSEEALALFSRMQNEGPKPNYVTYLGVLSACSHAGLVSQGRAYFNYIVDSNDQNIRPRREHYSLMIDLLGRSGHIEEAYSFIMGMPIEPDAGVWGALLGGCAIHKNVKVGQVAADKLFELGTDIASYHVLLSNMYASAGRWDYVDKVRLRMRKKCIKKVAAYSSIELNSEVYVFYSGDKSHPQSSSIYQKLEDLYMQIKSLGYISEVGSVHHDVEMEEKEVMLRVHSEKLAAAFGLINVEPEFPIRVIKNLRTCDDCHNFFKFISKISMREFIIRDKSRFHHFRNGICSCKDFW